MKKSLCVIMVLLMLFTFSLSAVAHSDDFERQTTEDIGLPHLRSKTYLSQDELRSDEFYNYYHDNYNSIVNIKLGDKSETGTRNYKDSEFIMNLILKSANPAAVLKNIYNSETDFAHKKWLLVALVELAGLGVCEDDELGFEFRVLNNALYSNVNTTLRSNKTIRYSMFLNNTNATVQDSVHPGAVQLSGQSYYYNCHSYAWTYHGNISGISESSLYWLNNPYDYYKNGIYFNSNCYTLVASDISPSSLNTSSLNDGDIIVWHKVKSSAEFVEDAGVEYIHSAIVVKSNNTVRYKSKWGPGGLYSHTLYGHPYAYARIQNGNANNFYNVERTISVIRPNHTINSGISPATGKFIIHTDKHDLLCEYCGRCVVSSDSHNFVTVGSITKCMVCNYRQGVQPNSSLIVDEIE